MNNKAATCMWRCALWQIGAVTATWAALPLAAWLLLPCRMLDRLFPFMGIGMWQNIALGGAMALVLVAALAGYLVERTRFYHRLKYRGVWWWLEWTAVAAAVGLVVWCRTFPWLLAVGIVWCVCGILARRAAWRNGGGERVRPSRSAIGTGIGLLALPLVSYGILVGLLWRENGRIAVGREALRQAGYMASEADVAASYAPIPAAEDGAPVLYELQTWIEANQEGSWKDSVAWLERLASPWPPAGDPVYVEARQFFAANSGYTELVDKLMTYDRARYRRDWSQGLKAGGVEGLDLMRALAQYGQIRMLIAWEAGDTAEALRIWRGMGNLRRQLLEDPRIISVMVAESIDLIRLAALIRGMNHFETLSEEQLRTVIADLGGVEAEFSRGYSKALQGESVFLMEEKPKKWFGKNGIWSGLNSTALPQFYPLPLVRAWRVAVQKRAYVEIMARLLAASQANGDELFRQLQAVNAESLAMSYLEDSGANMMGMVTLGTIGRFGSMALRRAVAMLAAAEGYYRSHGEFPEHAAQLVPAYLPAIPSDPYTGKAMRYHRISPSEVSIYSVGANQIDNGGEFERNSPQKGPDNGFNLKH